MHAYKHAGMNTCNHAKKGPDEGGPRNIRPVFREEARPVHRGLPVGPLYRGMNATSSPVLGVAIKSRGKGYGRLYGARQIMNPCEHENMLAWVR